MVAVHVIPRFVNFGLQTSEISPHLYCSEKLRGCNMFYFHSQCGSTADVKSYRPISNLSVVSKLLERLVSSQLVKYLKDNDLLPDLQSAYRAMHSTETAVLKVLADIGAYCWRWTRVTWRC